MRSRPSLIDLPLPPTLAGIDSSPPQSPIRHMPSLPPPALKKRPKLVAFIAPHLQHLDIHLHITRIYIYMGV